MKVKNAEIENDMKETAIALYNVKTFDEYIELINEFENLIQDLSEYIRGYSHYAYGTEVKEVDNKKLVSYPTYVLFRNKYSKILYRIDFEF